MFCFSNSTEAQEITINYQQATEQFPEIYHPGIFVVPKTANATSDLINNGVQFNSIRTIDIESALINSNENLLISHLKNAGGLPIQSSLIDKIAIFASEVGNPIILELLIDKLKFNIDSELNFNKQTALIIATISEKPTVVSYLLGKNANTRLADRNGKVAQDYAKGKNMKRLFKN